MDKLLPAQQELRAWLGAQAHRRITSRHRRRRRRRQSMNSEEAEAAVKKVVQAVQAFEEQPSMATAAEAEWKLSILKLMI